MNRREFLQQSAVISVTASTFMRGVNWPIGCFNRPWTQWSYDQTLDSIKAAGYHLTGLLTRTKDDPFIAADATPAYLESLKKKIAARDLKVNMGALRSRHSIPLEDSIRDVHIQIDNARILGLEYLLTFGVDDASQQDHYFRVMSDAAQYAQSQGLKLATKPHGGSSGAADDMLHTLERVNHPNFKIWFDAGNIIYYTGKDPVKELEPIARHVSGFCAKDCGSVKGEVMIQFGTGKVDFKSVFGALKAAGFSGPVMVECCAIAATPKETAANARANREFLEKVFASVS
jgi:sugar phosphate isomerase/epimerase